MKSLLPSQPPCLPSASLAEVLAVLEVLVVLEAVVLEAVVLGAAVLEAVVLGAAVLAVSMALQNMRPSHPGSLDTYAWGVGGKVGLAV